MSKDKYLEEGEREAKKCKYYENNCYCCEGNICYVFGKKIRKAKNCDGFEDITK